VGDVGIGPTPVTIPSGSENEEDGDEDVQSDANSQAQDPESEPDSEGELEAEPTPTPLVPKSQKKGLHGWTWMTSMSKSLWLPTGKRLCKLCDTAAEDGIGDRDTSSAIRGAQPNSPIDFRCEKEAV
jgi:hypothetical protein